MCTYTRSQIIQLNILVSILAVSAALPYTVYRGLLQMNRNFFQQSCDTCINVNFYSFYSALYYFTFLIIIFDFT